MHKLKKTKPWLNFWLFHDIRVYFSLIKNHQIFFLLSSNLLFDFYNVRISKRLKMYHAFTRKCLRSAVKCVPVSDKYYALCKEVRYIRNLEEIHKKYWVDLQYFGILLHKRTIISLAFSYKFIQVIRNVFEHLENIFNQYCCHYDKILRFSIFTTKWFSKLILDNIQV